MRYKVEKVTPSGDILEPPEYFEDQVSANKRAIFLANHGYRVTDAENPESPVIFFYNSVFNDVVATEQYIRNTEINNKKYGPTRETESEIEKAKQRIKELSAQLCKKLK